ncbi:[citrate (pro-3S)-lyase] ligase [Granulicatella seriolae]|uniref:[Citrate [pro-3S]-lyase] ligase n=1 Tax=Granulicatella seriolae TaxID=2967226 RepID=A0ABT1WQS0_9LACT|nr:[citrate (pro-3S)-lyase] ligase [Granulicatella seriolae]
MSDFAIVQIYPKDLKSIKKIEDLLAQEGIRKDQNLDYMCAIFDENKQVIATGSAYKDTLRCLAVDKHYQGEGLLNKIVSHLIAVENSRGYHHLFVYTKISSSFFFQNIGFYPIVTVQDHLVFMENRPHGFSNYLNKLAQHPFKKENAKISAVILNANPFSLGHLYLIETASKESDLVHVFMVSQDSSLFPFDVRKKLIIEGCAHLDNLVFHETGPYIISNSTFPSYFQKDSLSVARSHALLDISIFHIIAERLNIRHRYVGQEKTSQVTAVYNQVMQELLPTYGITLHEIERKKIGDTTISASTIRQYIKNGQIEKIKDLVPATTYQFLLSPEAKQIIDAIKASESVIHY